ncbi:MAG: inositol monophosphatase family protein, partial [Gammaproteobacteria bacterium]|nr:inositol monophosphatase family protein [Gammaproteobacteria bacterium]
MSTTSSAPASGGGRGGDPRRQLDAAELRTYLDAALRYADRCRDVISKTRNEGVEIDAKPDLSLVTSADLAAERAIREAVEAEFPEMGIIGEEFGASKPKAPFKWIIDPVDGTADFARGLPTWGSIIGLFFEGSPIVGVIDHPDLGFR